MRDFTDPWADRRRLLAVADVGLALSASAPSLAQPNRYDRADNARSHQHARWGRDYNDRAHRWRRGERMGYNDWRSARPVDYRAHHLRRPPRGYEWREHNGQYILAAVATGVIASIILNQSR